MNTLVHPAGTTIDLPSLGAHAAPAAAAWPTLREDLQLHHGPALPDGQPSWTLQDPVRHRFIRLDWLSHEVLSHWWLADPARIAEQISQRTTLAVEPEHVVQVLEWARREELVLPQAPPRPHGRAGGLQGLTTWLLHHYLFFRVPLFNPDRLLERLLPLTAWLGSPRFTRLTLVVLVLGLLGLSRNLGQVHAQWLDLLSWQGLALYGVTLAMVKVAHEFGHALVAKQQGLRVPTMGAAFMVMWPVAYTDTSEAWRLSDARARLRIAAAGVRTELTLAAWATLAWVLLPDGLLRTAAFIVATMTWVSSLLVNLSPFMRFDGYFLLCDLLDLPNLHERSFALARWHLRQAVLGWRAASPEDVAPARRRALIAFAWATWAYRLVLYLGIAWMVYHFGFPALGLMLFAVELGWFIAAPVWREWGVWAQGWRRWRAARRWRLSLLALLAGGALLAVPWPVRETAAAVLMPVGELAVHLPAPATLQSLSLQPGQAVSQGTPLLAVEAPALDQRLAAVQVRQRQIERQLDMASLSGEQQAQWQILQASLASVRDEATALRMERARLQPVAPFDAVVVERDPSLRPGMVISPRQTVLRLAGKGPARVVAMVSELAAASLQPGDQAMVGVDADPRRRWPARVVSVAPHASAELAEPMLARSHGGLVEAREQAGRWLPVQPLYRVELVLQADPGLSPRHWRAHVVIDLPARRPWDRAWRAVSEVLAREVGF